jgi:ketosteroid isomerase-like protein
MAAEDQENVALLREALLGREGAESFYELLDPEVEWDASRSPAGRVVRGRDAVRAFMPSWRHGWEHWRFEPDGFIETGDRVVALTPTGPATVWTFRDRKVVRFGWYEQASEALAEARHG